MPPDLPGLVDRLSSLTVIEAAELAKMLEEKWGVSASAPAQLAAGPVTPEPVAVEQSEFALILTSYGEKKVPVLKEVRSITGLDLSATSKLVSALPATLKESVSKEEAAKFREQIEKAGGTVEIR